jgi:5-bromo-4-chloroindolyl phosphate hydrolysis protein
MIFFTTLGYYVFVFSWGGSVMEIAINAVLLISLVIASIAIYYFAEKMKSRL